MIGSILMRNISGRPLSPRRQSGASFFEFMLLCLVIAIASTHGLHAIGVNLERTYSMLAQDMGGGSQDSMRDETGDPDPIIDTDSDCDSAGTC